MKVGAGWVSIEHPSSSPKWRIRLTRETVRRRDGLKKSAVRSLQSPVGSRQYAEGKLNINGLIVFNRELRAENPASAGTEDRATSNEHHLLRVLLKIKLIDALMWN